MSSLEVPGATLYFETVGGGPLLLCISGANGSADIWRRVAGYLKDHFTVAMYDRRGFSRSYLSGSQDYEHRLATDADDARRLIEHLSDEPATVLGNSSGAIVALELLTRHPSVVRTLIPHEPPAMKLLPDIDRWFADQQDIYDTYRRFGVPPAMQKFAKLVKAGDEMAGLLGAFDPRNGPFISANVMYWFERELLTYPFRDFNLDVLRSHKDQLLLANGRESNNEAPQYLANTIIAKQLELDLPHFPGAHLGFATHPKEFAGELLDTLKKKDVFYADLSL